MKILHLIDSAGLYGAEVMLLNLMRKQAENSACEPILASLTSDPDVEKPLEKCAREFGIRVFQCRMNKGLSYFDIEKVFHFAKVEKVDVLHAHGYKPNILLVLRSLYNKRFPLVTTVHGWTSVEKFTKMSLYEWLDGISLRFMDAVVLVNKKLSAHPRIQGQHLDTGRLFFVNNGISDISGYANLPINTLESVRSFIQGDFSVVTVGRLSPEKGFDFLIRALKILLDKGHKVRLVVIGDGPEQEHLQALSTDSGVSEYILFTGYVDNARKLLPEFKAYAISSLTEGLPITLLEAMQEGIPVVSTRVGGIPDVIENQVNGLLVESRNPGQLAKAIEKYILSPEFAEKVATNAKSIVLENYSDEKMCREYEQVYSKIVMAYASA